VSYGATALPSEPAKVAPKCVARVGRTVPAGTGLGGRALHLQVASVSGTHPKALMLRLCTAIAASRRILSNPVACTRSIWIRAGVRLPRCRPQANGNPGKIFRFCGLCGGQREFEMASEAA
jgi:hypothetical protein